MERYLRKGGRRRRAKWRWKEKWIEEVAVMRRVWGLGARLFKDDFRRRVMLFRYLVMEIIMYGGVRNNTKVVCKMVP